MPKRFDAVQDVSLTPGIADKIVKTPFMADSITQGTLSNWEKKIGEYVKQDETVANIETDKVTIPVNSPESGKLIEVFAKTGETVQVGSDLFKLDIDAKPPPAPKSKAAEKTAEKPAVEPLHAPPQAKVIDSPTPKTAPPSKSAVIDQVTSTSFQSSRQEHREKLTRMRLRIAERMKESQNTAASLTTFNEIDMGTLMELRNKYKDDFLKKHGIKFGFMSPFVKAASKVLCEIPVINAKMDLEKQEIIYHDFVDISVAVATPKGLVTPVLRGCERMSMMEIEKSINELGERARDNKISLEELTGGTFTISNGGVFGSLMGTPIINAPQSAILGMHAIKERPIVINGKIEIRPMMYVALTYDHRLIDGREAVTFLVRLKQLLEDPARFLLDL